MDEWRQHLFGQLVPEAQRPTTEHSAATALEIAFGMARSEVAYALELGRAHRVPVAGSVNGDDVWLALGPARLRFLYDRKNAHITVSIPGHDDARIAYDAAKRALTGPATASGPFEARTFVRSAIDATVAAWKAAPPGAPAPRWDAPPAPATESNEPKTER